VELPPGAEPPGVALAEQLRAIGADDDLGASRSGLAVAAAVDIVLGSEPAASALAHEAALGGELRTALARAVVAAAMVEADARLGATLPLDGDHRDALVAAIVARLGGSDRGIGAVVGRVGLNLALRLGVTKPVERRRAALTEAASPAAGDILHYLARGQGIRDFLAREVAAVAGPVVILAHSLGGIASVDLLASRRLPAVELLVTVGSQAPYLYELNALPMLEYGAELPPSVPRWVNVYDRRDLLSYTGAELFPGRAEDRIVDNRAPFPRSHSAYFGNDSFYAVLDEVLP
jgi:hypothetical protein